MVAAVAGPAAVKKKAVAGGVAAVLARHGIDPGLDAAELAAELTQRGWALTVEEEADSPEGGRPRRWRALATRPRPDARPRNHRSADHAQGSGRTKTAALARALATVLKREEG